MVPAVSNELHRRWSQRGPTVAVLGAVLGLLALAIWVGDEYQLVETRPTDLGIVALLALSAPTSWRVLRWLRGGARSQSGRRPVAQLELLAAVVVGVLGSIILLTLNAWLDRGRVALVPVILSHKYCNRGCRWILQSASKEQGSYNSMIVNVRRRDYERASLGDSVFVEVKPGFFGRPWIASYALHPLDLGPLEGALERRDTASLRALLDRGYPVDAVLTSALNRDTGEAPLTWAIKTHQRAAVAMLLSHGARVNRRTSHGETALMAAVSSGDPEMVRLLLVHGADPTATTEYHQYGDRVTSVMGMALASGDSLIIQLIADAIARWPRKQDGVMSTHSGYSAPDFLGPVFGLFLRGQKE